MSELTLPKSWTTIKLREIGTWRGGGTPSKSNPAFWTNGTIPWVSPKDMKQPRLSTAQDLITEAAVESSATNLVPAGSVLLVTRSGILAHSLPVAVNLVPVALNQDIKALTPHDITDAEYLRLVFQCFERDILNTCRKGGTTVHSIEFPALQEFTIPLPPLAEQKRIVAKIEELFSELEAGEESLRAARRQLGVYRQSLLKQAFEGKLTETWRAENPGKLESSEKLLARIPAPPQPRGGREASIGVIEGFAGLSVNCPSKPLPANWSWTPLLRIARQETGHTPSRNRPEYWDGEFSWMSIPDARMHHGRTITSTTQTITQLGLDNSSARLLPEGTVCLSRTASVGYVCIMGKSMATSQDFATWSCTPALMPKFLMYAFIAEGDEIRRFGKGTTHTTIYFPEIRALHIALPPVPEQQEIVRLLDEQFEAIERNEREIDAALKRSEALRQAILKKAFTGQLVLQDPTDEPASVLLARLQAERAQTPVARKRGRNKASL